MVAPGLIRIAARQVRVWQGAPANPSSAPNLLLLHGGLGDAQWHWQAVWNSLAETFTVAAPDHPRYGNTVALPRTAFPDLIDWLARVQELVGMSQAVVVGHSFGATLARLYAAAHPKRVSHLILVDGGRLSQVPRALRMLGDSPLTSQWLKLAREQTFSSKNLHRAFTNQELVTPELVQASQASSRAYSALLHEVTLGAIPSAITPSMPTLLVWGEKDRLTPIHRSYEIAAAIPNTELAVVKNAGHFPQIEDPLSFIEILRKYSSPIPKT